MDYLPLRVTASLKETMDPLFHGNYQWGTSFEATKSLLCDKMGSMNKEEFPENEETYLKLVLSHHFLQNNFLYTDFIDKCRDLIPFVMQVAGYTPDYLLAHKEIDIRTELRDFLVETILIDKWALNKQVLKVDKTFAYHLTQTDKLVLTKKMLEHLPFNNFYIDVSACDIFGDIRGIFCNITKISEKEFSLALYMVVDEDAMTFSYYNSFFFEDEDGDLVIDTTGLREEEIAHIIPGVNVSKSQIALKSRVIKIFVLQLLCYLTVPEADVAMSPAAKLSYHPNKVIKNKFREIKTVDVGIRIGSAITKKKNATIKQYEASDEYQAQNVKVRKPPVAHYRRAHWHRYWTGKGRTELKTKWVEPTFVCGVANDVVIHNVKGES